MPRQSRPLERTEGALRDTRLLVIASEDTHAVEQYFARFQSSRVKFRVLPTLDGCSSPAQLVERLDQERQLYDYKEYDEFWICNDTDHWNKPSHIANLLNALKECRDKNYFVAVSNPCFELWLLLHFQGVDPAAVTCAEVTKLLSKVAGGYRKDRISQLSLNKEMLEAATSRAIQLDTQLANSLPNAPCTRVYQIIQRLKELGIFNFS